MIEIDKNIPLPDACRALVKYPFATMEIGDSFFCNNLQQAVGSAAHVFCRKYPERKFVTRRVDGGTRCWRTK